MNPSEETAYLDGKRQAYIEMLGEAIRNLDQQGTTIATMIYEREQAIQTLRSVCERHGDNDWTPELHLSDIISKHLDRHIEEYPDKGIQVLCSDDSNFKEHWKGTYIGRHGDRYVVVLRARPELGLKEQPELFKYIDTDVI